jgi:Reverse transcriptase (RNA-dependent DNA polymerase)
MYFSTMDLRSGFWHVGIDFTDADKTAFLTRKGQYRFQVLSFGLANSPVIFQRLMSMILAGLAWYTCLVYIDDIIVVGRTFEDHLANVAEVLQRLKGAGLKLKASKCQFFKTRVRFLGHVVSRDGIEPDPDKVSCVQEWPVPQNLRELRSFLGLASYYQNFVDKFSVIARPLYELTRKDVRFTWTEKQQEAFETLKLRLTTASCLASPN